MKSQTAVTNNININKPLVFELVIYNSMSVLKDTNLIVSKHILQVIYSSISYIKLLIPSENYIDLEVFFQIPINYRDLRALAINKVADPELLLSLEIGSLTNLKVLDLSNSTMSDDLLTEIIKLKNLEELYLGKIYNLNQGFIKELAVLPNLWALGLESNLVKRTVSSASTLPNYQADSIVSIDIELNDLQLIAGLRHLNLVNIHLLKKEYSKLCELENLTSIALKDMMIDAEIMKYFANTQSLEEIAIINCRLIGWVGAKEIEPLETHLKILKFKNIEKIEEKYLDVFRNNLEVCKLLIL